MKKPSPMATVRALVAMAFLGVVVSCSTTEAVPAPACEGAGCVEPRFDASVVDGAPALDAGVLADAADGAAPRVERVLFIGNSYTEFNDLPRVVRELGAETGAPIVTEAVLVGGATLYDHWSKGDANGKIDKGNFDAVVLQGQSLEALGGEGGFDTYAQRFGDQVKAAGSRAVWYATWARGPGASANMRGEAVANRIEQAYSKVAIAKGGKVARVGAAFLQAQIRLPQVPLYIEDQSHPTKEGTFLAACTIAHTLTGKVPRVPDPAPLGIPRATAQALCNLAADVRCLEGGELCDGTCFKLQTDPKHCGTCAKACAAGDPCIVGQCGCPTGATACSLECRYLQSDRDHCGACGKACDAGRYCSSGACVCSGGSVPVAVSLPQLAAIDPGCTELGQSPCDNAAKQVCLSRGCAATGLGPASGHAPSGDSVLCLSTPVPAQVDYSALQAMDARCDGITERHGEGCVTAVNRYCQSQGAVGGFGHYPATGTQVAVTCLGTSRALAVTVDNSALQAQASRCVPHAVTCNTAAWNLCKSFGFVAGVGPVEASADLRTVLCVRN